MNKQTIAVAEINKLLNENKQVYYDELENKLEKKCGIKKGTLASLIYALKIIDYYNIDFVYEKSEKKRTIVKGQNWFLQ